ncbi:MAG: sialidase family protein [Candidatus Zixiibacteriota bacterium]
MDTFITNTTAQAPLGISGNKRVFTITGGTYTGRTAIVYAPSANSIALVYADSPYVSFSSPLTIVSDSADVPFDAFMDGDNTIHIAYIVDSGANLAYIKFTFANGEWSVGSPVTAYDADPVSSPSIIRLSTMTIGIAFTRDDSGTAYLCYKESTDGGASWGTLSDPGQTLTAGASEVYGRMLEINGYLYIFYTEGTTALGYRRRTSGGSVFDSAVTLSSGTGFSETFSVCAKKDGRIAVAFTRGDQLVFREYSGSSWSGESIITSVGCEFVSVSYYGSNAYVVFGQEIGDDMTQLLYARYEDGAFNSPQALDDRKAPLQKVIVYDESAGSLVDRTSEAASTASSDIVHPNIGGMFIAAGDSIFFGMSRPFHSLSFNLGTAGVGGEVVWRYFTGQVWQSLTPHTGLWNFTTERHDMLLWKDYQSIPGDWQKKIIEGSSLYWIAATVTTPYTTPPVGSQITAVSTLTAISQV